MAKQVNHAERKHALLSASKAERWLNCPPSARLEEKFNESNPPVSSVYADEGTLAHEFANIMLDLELGNIDANEFKAESNKLKKNALFQPEMITEVRKFVDYVLEQYHEAQTRTGGQAVCLVEQNLDFSNYVEEGFGTGDAVVIGDGIMEVIDLKYGKGVQVDAVENPQLSLYGLGAMNVYDMMYDFDKVKLTIFQPRIDNFSTWETTTAKLVEWGEKTVKPIAQKAYVGEGLHKAGEHCRWCSVKAMCYTLAQRNIKLARKDFKEPELLTLKELIDIYKQIPMLVDWANSVRDYLQSEAVKGTKIPGYKVVAGRSNRKLTNEKGMRDKLAELGYSEDQYEKKTLIGIPDIEKLVGKPVFNKDLKEFWEKPEGVPTLVPESDARPAIDPTARAQKDFA